MGMNPHRSGLAIVSDGESGFILIRATRLTRPFWHFLPILSNHMDPIGTHQEQ